MADQRDTIVPYGLPDHDFGSGRFGHGIAWSTRELHRSGGLSPRNRFTVRRVPVVRSVVIRGGFAGHFRDLRSSYGSRPRLSEGRLQRNEVLLNYRESEAGVPRRVYQSDEYADPEFSERRIRYDLGSSAEFSGRAQRTV